MIAAAVTSTARLPWYAEQITSCLAVCDEMLATDDHLTASRLRDLECLQLVLRDMRDGARTDGDLLEWLESYEHLSVAEHSGIDLARWRRTGAP